MLIEDAERLEKIDQLYGLRLDQLVSLPVVCLYFIDGRSKY